MEYFLLTVFILLIYMHFETRRFEVTNVDINMVNDRQKVNFTIVHLSDLHFRKIFVNLDKVIDVIRSANADCIVLSGDYAEGKGASLKFLRFLEKLVGIGLPVFLVWGNHEHKIFRQEEQLNDFRREIESRGAKVIVNESASFEKGNKILKLIGLDDLVYGVKDVERAFLDRDNEGNSPANTIVVTHNPDMLFELTGKAFDVMLCGHFHGGQIYMPFHFEFKLLRNERMCKAGIIKGLHYVDKHWIYINRGLGNVCFPFRFLSTPEIAVVRMYEDV